MSNFLSRSLRVLVTGIVLSVALPALAQSEENQWGRMNLRAHLAPLFFMGDVAEIRAGASGSKTVFDPGIGADVGLEIPVGKGVRIEANLGLYRLESETHTYLSWGEPYTSHATLLFIPLDLSVNLYSWENDRSVGYGGAFATWQFGSGGTDDVTIDGEYSWGLLLGTDRRIGDHRNRLSLQLRLRQLVVTDPGFGGSDAVFGISFRIGLNRTLSK